jgi:hypothetical protein
MAPPPEAPKQNGRKRDHDEMEGIVAHYSEEDKWKLIRRVMEGLEAAYRIETDQEQAVTLFENYMKMSDGRRRRHNESELRRLMWAWRVLKRRHEKRVASAIAKEAAASTIVKEAAASAAASAAERVRTPPRHGLEAPKEELLGSPTNPIDEWRVSKERHEREVKAREIAKDASAPTRQKMGTEIGIEVRTKPQKTQKLKQQQRRKKSRVKKQVNNHHGQIRKIGAAEIERRISPYESTEPMDGNNNNHHYFWHRGRPPEAEPHQT